MLTNGLPQRDVDSYGRIEIAYAKSSPNILYAVFADWTFNGLFGIYKTNDYGSGKKLCRSKENDCNEIKAPRMEIRF